MALDLSVFEANYTPYDVGSTAPTQKKKKKGFLVDQISTAGGILGGIGGSFLGGPVGTVGGAAAGSALGETLENALTGNRLLDNVGKEAALGGVFALPPVRAAKAGISALRGSKVAANAADTTLDASLKTGTTQIADEPLKTSMRGQLSKVGNKLLSSQYGTIGKPIGRKTNPEETFGRLADVGLVKPDDVERVADSITGSGGILNKAVVKATGESGRVDVSDLRQIMTDALENYGVVGKDAKSAQAIFDAQMKKMLGGPKGSLDPTANPSDVLDAMKAFEARIAQKTGKGGNYRLPTDETESQAKALTLVKDELQDRLESGADVKNILTPQFRNDLIKLSPGNQQWQNYVDNTVMKSKDIASLRSAQAPFVNAKQIIEEADINSMTAGGRVGNATAAGMVGSILDPIAGALANIATSAARTPIMRNAGLGLRKLGGEGSQATGTARVPSKTGLAVGAAARVGAGGLIGGAYNQLASGSAPQQMPESSLASALSQPALSQDAQIPQDTQTYSRESALSDIQRDPANADYYMQLYEFANPKNETAELGAQASKDLSLNANATNTVDQLEQFYQMAGGGSGKLGGTIRNKLSGIGYDDSTQAYNETARSSLAQIARALGAGNPSDADIAIQESALPKITDSPEVAKAKFDLLRQKLMAAQQNALRYNTAGSGGAANTLDSALNI